MLFAINERLLTNFKEEKLRQVRLAFIFFLKSKYTFKFDLFQISIKIYLLGVHKLYYESGGGRRVRVGQNIIIVKFS